MKSSNQNGTRRSGVVSASRNPHLPRKATVAKWDLATRLAFLLVLQVSALRPLQADTHYVSPHGAAIPPYTNWAAAAREVQPAIDAASSGDTVLVTNGVYETGGRVMSDSTMNRIAVTNAVHVKSVNGPKSTIIRGRRPIGDNAVRCAWLSSDSALSGFTLTGGATRAYPATSSIDARSGGGAWCVPGAVLSNCIFSGNAADSYGGGVYQGTLHNCTLTDNSTGGDGGGAYGGVLNSCVLSGNTAYRGGGARSSKLYHCTVSGNSAENEGGGVYNGQFYNSIIYYNSARSGDNHASVILVLQYCCTTPHHPLGAFSNITNEPALVSASRIAVDSPCVGAGEFYNYTSGVDTDGEAWRNPPAIGADEPYATTTGALTVVIGMPYATVSMNHALSMKAEIDGPVTSNAWDFGDGGAQSNRAYVDHAWSQTGTYDVVLTAWSASYPDGVSATATVTVADTAYYANCANPTPVYPYTNWMTAATNIQDAIDAADVPGRLVFVTNGLYDAGGRIASDVHTNRIVLTHAARVMSVNGPHKTVIEGRPGSGESGVRCAWVGEGCLLAGFTLTNGAADTVGTQIGGGGARCEPGGVVSNCVLVGNTGYFSGGAYAGELHNCVLADNTGNLYGGAYYSTLHNCALSGNRGQWGGGVSRGSLNSCTVSGNSASRQGGGVYQCTLRNCIVYGNTAPEGENYHFQCAFQYSCTTPHPGGDGCITNNPRLAAGADAGLRVQASSPCIDAGLHEPWMDSGRDLDGHPRVFNGAVDMGAYEFTMLTEANVLLEGAFDTNLNRMTTALRDAGYLPTTAPYTEDTALVEEIPSNTTDWLLLQLVETNTYQVVTAKSVLLQRDGALRDRMGDAAIRLEVSPGHYYVAARHRNHCTAMSARPVAYTNERIVVDFTVDAALYHGGTNACVPVGSNRWAMVAGDADGDGSVTPIDRQVVTQQMGMTGYLPGDLNLDGVVDGDDE